MSAYQGGRLVVYCLIGAIAGIVGTGIEETGTLLGLQRAAVWIAGSLLIGVGLVELGRVSGFWSASLHMPERFVQGLARLHRATMKLSPTARAGTVGVLSGLMPCGWLYAFALSAAATARIDTGMLVMAVFWAGSVPMLTTIGWGGSAALAKLVRKAPYVTALVLIAAGLFTLSYRQVNVFESSAAAQDIVTSSEESNPNDSLINHIQSLDHQELPCCADHDSQTR